jgi:hypothetical protein
MVQKLFKHIDGAIDSTAALGQQVMERGASMGGFPVDQTVTRSKQIFATREDRYFYPSDEWLMSHGLPEVGTVEWSAFDKFMNNAYFTRVWIIQEIQVSGTATIR